MTLPVKQFSRKEFINTIIMSLTYILLFFSGFLGSSSYNFFLGLIGWVIWFLALLLAFSPNFSFKKKGGVPEGKSYVHTTKLVDTGIYGIIRHPQYTGGIIICFSVCLIIQNPYSYFLAVIASISSYLAMIFEENRLIEKFSNSYVDYMDRVPRSNLIIGLLRR